MKLVDHMRKKYEINQNMRPHPRRPAGGNDVIALCNKIDRLNHIIGRAFTMLDADDANIIAGLLAMEEMK